MLRYLLYVRGTKQQNDKSKKTHVIVPSTLTASFELVWTKQLMRVKKDHPTVCGLLPVKHGKVMVQLLCNRCCLYSTEKNRGCICK